MSSDPAEPLLSLLRTYAIPQEMHEHPAYFTVDDGRDHRARMEGAHTKNLFLKDKKSRHVLISAHEASPVDLKSMHQRLSGRGLHLSGRLSFAGADRMMAWLGVAPGSVTPFGLMHDHGRDVAFVLDEALMAFEKLNVHPRRNTATVSLLRDDFLKLMQIIGHPPLICALNDGVGLTN